MSSLHSKVLDVLPANISETSVSPDTMLVSYFDTDKAKPIKIKLGRLLTKQTSLTELEIKNLVEFQRRTLKGVVSMELTQDADEIVEYYTIHVAPQGGSSSCMCNESCVRVYSYDNNLFLATFYDGEDTSLDNYVGRCLVRKDTMEYIRTYATLSKYQDYILATLELAGYTKGNLVGIKLAKEETRVGYIMPYLDWSGMCVEDQGDHFEVVSYSTVFKADTTTGIMYFGRCCSQCTNVSSEENMYHAREYGYICDSCLDEYFTFFNDTLYSYDVCTRVIGGEYDGDYIPTSLLEDYNYFEPQDATEYYHIELLESCEDGLYLSENCVELAETINGYDYAPENECIELDELDLVGVENCEQTWELGWYTEERYKEIKEEIQEQREIIEAGQTDLIDLIEELA